MHHSACVYECFSMHVDNALTFAVHGRCQGRRRADVSRFHAGQALLIAHVPRRSPRRAEGPSWRVHRARRCVCQLYLRRGAAPSQLAEEECVGPARNLPGDGGRSAAAGRPGYPSGRQEPCNQNHPLQDNALKAVIALLRAAVALRCFAYAFYNLQSHST